MTFFAGCAGSELAMLPGDLDGFAGKGELPRELTVGDNARVVLKTGESVGGEVTALDHDFVTLSRTGNYGNVETELRARDIMSIERNTGGNAWIVAPVVGIVLGVVLWQSLWEWGLP